MRVIVAGSRDITDPDIVQRAIEDSGFLRAMTELVCGDAPGVDSIADELLRDNVPVKHFPADWSKHGRAAGPLRNSDMSVYADALIAVMWEVGSLGTKDMIRKMYALKKQVFIHLVQGR